MNLMITVRSELKKLKRTSALYVTVFAAFFGPLMSMLDLLLDGIEPDHRNDIFNDLLINKFQMTGLVAFPIFLVLICTLLPQTEYRNNTWKQVLTSPQPKGYVFLAKFINVLLLIVIFLLFNLLFVFADAVLLHFLQPSLHVLSQPINGKAILLSRVNSFVALLAICSIQFWMGMKFKNFIVPLAAGIALWFMGTILVMQNLEMAAWFPYSFHAYGSFPKYHPENLLVGWTSVVYAALFLVLGFVDFRRREMK